MKHPKDIQGYTLEGLAQKIGGLHYESLEKFLLLLAEDIRRQSVEDLKKERNRLWYNANEARMLLLGAASYVNDLKTISEPYQETEDE